MLKGVSRVDDLRELLEKDALLEDVLTKLDINKNATQILYQFLLRQGLDRTAESLSQEVRKVLLNNEYPDDEISKDSCERILSDFYSSDWKEFFKSWHNLIPPKIRDSKDYKILTFKLRIYFATPKREEDYSHLSFTNGVATDEDEVEVCKSSNLSESEKTEIHMDSMEQLKEYLANDGQELKKESELHPFFAFPYISDPRSDSSVSKIFKETWKNDLIMNLKSFLDDHCQVQVTQISDETSKKDQCAITTFESEEILVKLPAVESDLDVYKWTREVIENSRQSRGREISGESFLTYNDRNIPIFSEEDEEFEQYDRYHFHAPRIMKTKGVQTEMNREMTTVNNGDLQTNVNPMQELVFTKSHLYYTRAKYEKLKQRFRKLHTDYHKLMEVTGILTNSLEDSVRGEAIDVQNMLESCMKVFPDLFNQNVKGQTDTEMDQSASQKSEDILYSQMCRQPATFKLSPVPPKLLDYKKIKLHLISGNVKTKLLLLQALRWKLTLTQPGERDEAIHEYISNDLFGFRGQIALGGGTFILPYLLLTPVQAFLPHPLQQSSARLLNALASFRSARDYFCIGPSLADVIIKCLDGRNNESIDSITCDMLIGVLQKISLRRQQRIYMIDNGLLEWLIYHLNAENYRMSSYRLVYATALLMNLSLHKRARFRATKISRLIISTLMTLLSTERVPQALPYINGALNNFLANNTINNEAKKTKLASILEQHRKRHSGELRKNFEHILKIHRRECTEYEEDNEDEEEKMDDEEAYNNEDNEDLDILEGELEEEDPVKFHTAELFGEALLATCYSTSFPKPKVVTITDKPNTMPTPRNFETESVKKYWNENADSLYTNEISKESSKTTLDSSVTLPSVQQPASMDRLSSIASLNSNDPKNDTDYEADAFVPKPKILRTPPQSATHRI